MKKLSTILLILLNFSFVGCTKSIEISNCDTIEINVCNQETLEVDLTFTV